MIDRHRLNWDACASKENAKLPNYWTKEEDALSQDWKGKNIWMNPPYGRDIGKWTEKARLSGAFVVGLLPVRSCTKWWHRDVVTDADLLFIKGRIRFDGATNCAPFPSVLAIWDPEDFGGFSISFELTKEERGLVRPKDPSST